MDVSGPNQARAIKISPVMILKNWPIPPTLHIYIHAFKIITANILVYLNVVVPDLNHYLKFIL